MPFDVTEMLNDDEPRTMAAVLIRRYEDGTETPVSVSYEASVPVTYTFENIDGAATKALEIQMRGGSTRIVGGDSYGTIEMHPNAGRAFLRAIKAAGPDALNPTEPQTKNERPVSDV